MDARRLTAHLSDHHKTELIAAGVLLVTQPLRLPDSVLDDFALRLRIESPRPRDLPTLPPRSAQQLAPTLVAQARAALQIPPPVTLIGRGVELARVVQALCEGRSVCLSLQSIGKTTFLRALAADSRLQTHFVHVWWLETPLPRSAFVNLLALALDVPDALDATPEAQLSILRGALERTKTLLICDWSPAEPWLSALAPYVVWQTETPPSGAECITLDALPEPVVLDYLAAHTRLTESERAQLAALIGGSPALLRLCAALLAEDDLTLPLLLDLLRSAPPAQRYTALLNESINSFPAEYRAICHALAATPVKCLPSALIAARFAQPVAARRALSFLARRQLIELHDTHSGELCSVLFNLPEPLRLPESAPFDVPVRDFELFNQVAYLEDERAAQAAFLQRQGIALIEENRLQEARQALEQALAIRQTLNLSYAIAETLSALGRLAYLSGDAAKAAEHLEAAAEVLHKLQDTTALDTVRLALCRVYAFAGRLEAALAVADDKSMPATDLAALYCARGQWSEALACYERALSSESDEEDWLAAQIGRAETLILAGRQTEALRSASGGSFTALWARALALHLSGDLAGALDAYNSLEAVTPHAWRSTVARAKARALAAAGNLREAALLVGAEGVWYEARQPYPALGRQRLSLALYAHLCLMLGETDEAQRAAQESRTVRAERADPEAETIACCVLGRIARQKGDSEQATAAFEAALKALNALRDDQTRANLLHILGDLQRERGDFERAATYYRRALGFAPSESALTHLALAESLEAIARIAEALEAGAEAITVLHSQRETADLALLSFAYTRQADRQKRMGRIERAQAVGEHWLQILAARFDEAIAHFEPAVQALAIGMYLRSALDSALDERDPIELVDLAERALQIAEQLAPHSVATWAARRDLAELYRRIGRLSDAMEVLAPLLDSKREQIEDAYRLLWRDIFLCAARAYRLPAYEYDNKYYSRAFECEPDTYARALICLEEARFYRRVYEEKTAAAIDLDDFSTRLTINRLVYSAASGYQCAAAYFKRASSERQLAEALTEAGRFYVNVGQYGRAIKALQAALHVFGRALRPEPRQLAQLYADLGTAQANVGRASQAAESFKQALRLIDQFSAPERYAAILTAFARAEMRLKAYQSAATAYQEVLQFDHPPAERQKLLTELGKALRRLNQLEAAIRAYESALDIPEGNAKQRASLERSLAECYTALNDYDSARLHYERAIAQAPEFLLSALWNALGALHRRYANLQAALDAYMQALARLNWRLQPSRTIAAERAIGEIHLALNQPTQAIPHLARAFKLERQRKRKIPANLIASAQSLAAAYESCGDLTRAAAYQHSALVYQDAQREPEAALATLSELQRLYMQLGQHNEVLRVCTEALKLEKTLSRPNAERLSQTYLALGKAQRALSMLDYASQSLSKALQSAPNPEAERL
ncbi:MAG: tetratricopeptide repeat protein, partial [Anaerolineae bacterium]|nr:tetratricopeptide repeat protein [Anaerolineae bacterium]